MLEVRRAVTGAMKVEHQHPVPKVRQLLGLQTDHGPASIQLLSERGRQENATT